MLNQNSNYDNVMMKKIKGSNFSSYSGLLLVITVVSILLAWLSPNHTFLTSSNILNVLRQVSVYGIISVGMAFVMIGGGIDLSVGSTAGLVGVISASLVTSKTTSLVTSIFIGIIIGAIIGVVNGAVIAYSGIPPFVMTLACNISVRGVAYIVCDGKPIGNLPKNMQELGTGMVFGIPVPILIMILMFIIGWVILSKTSLGRSIYAVGGNMQAAHLAGVKIKNVLIMTYLLAGAMSALGGIVLTGRNTSAQPTAGSMFETEAIAGCAMGGVAFTGGSGSVVGVFLGVFLLGIINNGMNLLGISSYWQLVVKGIIIAGAVIYSIGSSKTKSKPSFIRRLFSRNIQSADNNK